MAEARVPTSLEGMSADDIYRLAEAGQLMLTSDATRNDARKLYKKVNPSANFPELELEARLAKEREDREAEFAKRDKEQAEERARQKRQENLRAAAAIAGDDVAKIVKGEKPDDPAYAPIERFMIDNGITNYESAARLYQLQQQQNAPQPTNFGDLGTAPSLPKMDFKEGEDISSWARRVAVQTSNDIRSGKAKFNEQGIETR